MKDMFEMLEEKSLSRLQLILALLLPFLVIYGLVAPQETEALSRLLADRLGWLSDYLFIFSAAQRGLLIACVLSFLWLLCLSVIGIRVWDPHKDVQEGEWQELMERRYAVGRPTVRLTFHISNWYWLSLGYGVVLDLPVHSLLSWDFWLALVLGLWLGPVFIVVRLFDLLFARPQKGQPFTLFDL